MIVAKLGNNQIPYKLYVSKKAFSLASLIC